MKEVLGLTRVRTVVTVSDAVSPEERDFYSALNLNMRKLYGPTAACGMLTLSDDGKVLHADSGRPVGDMELRIGKSRAIEFKGPHAAGPNPAIEPGAPGSVDAEGWCNTGEAGRLDSGARLTLLGAVDDLGVMTDGTEFIPHIVEQNLQASPYIRHAVVFGDRKPFVTALLVLNASTVSAWAERNGVRFTESSVCAELDDIFSLINGQVNQANRRLAAAGYGKLQVKRFAVLRRELDADAGELTLKRQPCRAVIETRHAGLIAALFGDGSEYVVGEAQGEIQESATDKEHVRISSLIPEAESNQPPRVSSGGTPRQVARSGT
jgi:long-chain acyl-CoA synthetase